MIPELPEKESSGVKTGPAPSTSRSVSPPRLTDMYEQEVLDFVTSRLDAGYTDAQIIDDLRTHDFSREEARRLVRALSEGRSRNVAEPQHSPKAQWQDEKAEFDGLIAAAIEAGNREMVFGALWFVGGLILTLFSFAAQLGGKGILFWGAIVWGPIQFFRGANRVAAAKRIRDNQ